MDLVHIVEALASLTLAILSYFGKRTLNGYDNRLEAYEKRFEKFEDRDDDIMKALKDIEIKIAHIETVIDVKKFRASS